MKIQYASDLHLEFVDNVDYLKANPLEVAGDILVLAGDTIYLGDRMEDAGWFFDWCSRNFKQTYIVPGNHEYYGHYPMEDTMHDWELKVRENVSYVNNKSVVIGKTEIFFTTLWTHIPAEEAYTIAKIMNDCRNNRYEGKGFGSRSWNKVHKECLQWLQSAVEASSAKHKVVVTHHCPYVNEAAEQYVGWLAKKAYMVDVLPMFAGCKIDHWIHGHVHIPMQSASGQPQIHSNPMGYVDDGENRGFRNNALIELQMD